MSVVPLITVVVSVVLVVLVLVLISYLFPPQRPQLLSLCLVGLQDQRLRNINQKLNSEKKHEKKNYLKDNNSRRKNENTWSHTECSHISRAFYFLIIVKVIFLIILKEVRKLTTKINYLYLFTFTDNVVFYTF